jgi:hypothetical protein
MKKKKIILLMIAFIILLGFFIFYFLFLKTKSISPTDLAKKEKSCNEQLENHKKSIKDGYDNNKFLMPPNTPLTLDDFVVGYSQKLDSCIGGYSERTVGYNFFNGQGDTTTYFIIPTINTNESGTVAIYTNTTNKADRAVDLENAIKFRNKFNELTNGVNTGISINDK